MKYKFLQNGLESKLEVTEVRFSKLADGVIEVI